jgi:hypothetical protein
VRTEFLEVLKYWLTLHFTQVSFSSNVFGDAQSCGSIISVPQYSIIIILRPAKPHEVAVSMHTSNLPTYCCSLLGYEVIARYFHSRWKTQHTEIRTFTSRFLPSTVMEEFREIFQLQKAQLVGRSLPSCSFISIHRSFSFELQNLSTCKSQLSHRLYQDFQHEALILSYSYEHGTCH